MNTRQKLSILADAAKYDASCASSGSKGRRPRTAKGLGSTNGEGICHSYTPDGRCVSLLKILLTNYCVYDCRFCINRSSSDTPRARFEVDEIVRLTLDFYRRNYIEGLFLSSGIIRSADYTLEQMVEVARGLREDHDFAGYIHLKTIPGASPELVDRAGQFSDRLSCNIELPTEADLAALAPEKRVADIHSVMTRQHLGEMENREERRRMKHAPVFAPAGQSSQMVIGATASPDRAILTTASDLYDRFAMRRVYYSAYSPIVSADARMENQPADLLREHRLYQADWLLRFYDFSLDEIVPADEANLDRELDPKLAAALRHPERFPIDLNRASKAMLLRIPGLGTRSVERILAMRRLGPVRIDDLSRLRVSVAKVRPFAYGTERRRAGRDVLEMDATRRRRHFIALRDRLLQPGRQLDLFTEARVARDDAA